MGNTTLSSPDADCVYGRTTQQIDGVLTLTKSTAAASNTKQRRRAFSLPWNTSRSSQSLNKSVKSLLMRSILARDWQKVLIRARLFPNEVHEFTVLEIPLLVSRNGEGIGSGPSTTNQKGKTTHRIKKCIRIYRAKVLPIHAACALRPPPEVVRVLLSHAIGSAFSSNRNIRGIMCESPKTYKTNRRDQPKRRQQVSSPIPLYNEHNMSLATVAVERIKDSSLGKSFFDKLCLLGDMARRGPFREKSCDKKQDCQINGDDGSCDNYEGDIKIIEDDLQDSPNHQENAKDVALFLKRMEDHLAHNGRCRSEAREMNKISSNSNSNSSSRHRSARSIFVLDFDPSVLLPSPSTIKASEKQTRALLRCGNINSDNVKEAYDDEDLFSLENSIGDVDTAMTTSTPCLVGRGDGKDCNESSSLEYLDESMSDSSSSSSASSSLLKPPTYSDVDDDSSNGSSSNDSNSFLQLTADGGLAVADLQDSTSSSEYGHNRDDSNTNIDCHRSNWHQRSNDTSESFTTNDSSPTNTDSQPSSGPSSNFGDTNYVPKFVPEDIQLSSTALFRSLPRVPRRKRGQDTGKAKDGAESLLHKEGQGICGHSRLLPLHIACLYGASASILNILSQEYPEGSSVEVLGMLPVHIIAANWSLSNVVKPLESKDGNDGGSTDNWSIDDSDSERDRLATLIDCSPRSLWANSSAHGLRPLEYTRILLCYTSNASDKGINCARSYLDSKEKEHGHSVFFDVRASRKCSQEITEDATKTNSRMKFPNKKLVTMDCGNHPIETASTCTTSGSTYVHDGASIACTTNDYSSTLLSPVLCSQTERQISLGMLLSQKRWEEAINLLETNVETAKERCCHSCLSDAVAEYDRSGSTFNQSIGGSFSSEWRGPLPIHVVCHVLRNGDSVPIGLVRLIVYSYLDGLKQTDSLFPGSLPLHLICDSFRPRAFHGRTGCRDSNRFFASSRLQVLQLLLTNHPFATRVIDHSGKLPLHRAILAEAPFEAIRLLVYRDPRAIALPDRDGMTPFSLAKKVYASDSSVIELLEQAWIC